MTDASVRGARSADFPALAAVAAATGMFSPEEMDFLQASMARHFEAPEEGHRWTVLHRRDAVIGAAYLAPEMPEGVFNLLFIGVLPEHRRAGGATALLADAEAHLRAVGARLLVVDTSSLPRFAPARALYARHGHDEEARIRDWWAPGDDKVTFRKAL